MKFSPTPLGALVSAILLGAAMPASSQANSLSFKGVPVPVTADDGSDWELRGVLASQSATVNGEKKNIGYHILMRSGQGFDTQAKEDVLREQLPFGTLIDIEGKPLLANSHTNDGATKSADDDNPFLSNDIDFNSLLTFDDKLFLISHLESRPAGMYITGLDQNSETGELTPRWTHPIDFSEVRGGWVHCAGSKTPWNTHLGSEEYEPDARLVDPATGVKVKGDGSVDTYYGAMFEYFGGQEKAPEVNPYDYGYPVEVSIQNAAGKTKVVKHYAMGRVALELAYVMPDNRTAYLTDDGRMTGLYMFIADQPGDLSAGTLYAARWVQTSPSGVGLGEANLAWINLGHASDDEIADYLTGKNGKPKVTFADLFEASTPTSAPNGDATCPKKHTLVAKGHEQTAGATYAECLDLQKGMKKVASRLETRRYAALQGATTELTKEEGITYDPDLKRLYIAMSDVTDGMLDNASAEQYSGKLAGPNDVRVAQNRCGAVYAADISKKPNDTDGKTIKSKYVAVNIYPLVAGKTVDYTGTKYEGNTCDVDGIASPDNLSYLPKYKTLIIGEDTSSHRNDMVWAYNTEKNELTRIQTTPYGSETTSVYWYPNINGFGYLMSVIQHPFGESDSTKYNAGSSADRGYAGYIGPFPALD